MTMHPTNSPAGPTEISTSEQQLLYQWGAGIADEMANVGATDPKELEWVFRGVRDRVAGKSRPFSAEEQSQLTKYLLDRIQKNGVAEQAQSVVYLSAKAREPNAVVSGTGIVYRETLAGDGAQPAAESTVKVEYVGKLRNGWVFDSSRQRGTPLETSLTGVIKCWQEAIPMMKVGGKATVTCPPSLAYGDGGTYNIPPGSALTFDVELLEVRK
ncbi:MAG: FKBP-type peptidyl-prolyl cis-trans isomerase [Gammaproteobacteria bacterium]